ncbi:biliverdin-producing heme oxygenase [Chitinophaga filiformis]|uniref:biliverdin-producing heme oxygenase n=1 Tax=Chitinophaga filiformis TaxID=104663 RepID=UPI001F25832C|nr:biliverdin-producing heme oxygenase [Chitinophaga filiformis]MCF6406503.1 biliverdin-producing heme oxygenase [Chitinophaga filiformis]
MIELLRERTNKQHQELESVLIPIIKKVSTPEEYVRLLELFYGYYYPLEQHIAAHMDISFPGGFERRRKAPLLLDDIAAITGGPAAEPSLSTDLPEITDNAQALGVMYVLEYLTLEGHLIYHLLLRNVQSPELPRAMTFFNGYGTDTESYWETFAHYLNGYHGTEEQRQRMLDAATDTFLKFKAWAIAAQAQQ